MEISCKVFKIFLVVNLLFLPTSFGQTNSESQDNLDKLIAAIDLDSKLNIVYKNAEYQFEGEKKSFTAVDLDKLKNDFRKNIPEMRRKSYIDFANILRKNLNAAEIHYLTVVLSSNTFKKFTSIQQSQPVQNLISEPFIQVQSAIQKAKAIKLKK